MNETFRAQYRMLHFFIAAALLLTSIDVFAAQVVYIDTLGSIAATYGSDPTLSVTPGGFGGTPAVQVISAPVIVQGVNYPGVFYQKNYIVHGPINDPDANPYSIWFSPSEAKGYYYDDQPSPMIGSTINESSLSLDIMIYRTIRGWVTKDFDEKDSRYYQKTPTAVTGFRGSLNDDRFSSGYFLNEASPAWITFPVEQPAEEFAGVDWL